MGISRSLTRVAQHLLGARAGSAETFVHCPTMTTLGRSIAVTSFRTPSGAVHRGTGVARSEVEAFLKSVLELGEVIHCQEAGVSNRSGMAGGLLLGAAIERARSELIERDAFLHHYRGGIPLQGAEFIIAREGVPPGRGEIMVFLMSPAVPGVRCVLVTDELSVMGAEGCIWFGLGSHPDFAVAVQKALGEYASMMLDHELRPGWCARVFDGIEPASCLPDLHHAASHDPRNRRRFREICGSGKRQPGPRPMGVVHWLEREVPSPVRYFRFVHSVAEGLIPLEFGIPESIPENESPLLHPIW